MARSVADLALLDAVVTGEEIPLAPVDLRGLRIGLPRRHFWNDLDEAMDPALSQARVVLADAGVVFQEIDIRPTLELCELVSQALIAHEPRRDIEAYLKRARIGVTFEELLRGVAGSDVKALLEMIADPALPFSEASYVAAVEMRRPAIIASYGAYFSSHGIQALMFPTTPLPARPIGQDSEILLNGRAQRTFATYIRNTDPGSVAGLPGVSLPAGLTADGLPVGLALDGLPFADRHLLSLAAAIEAVLPRLPAPQAALVVKT